MDLRFWQSAKSPPPYPDPTKFSSAFTLLESTAPTPCNAVDSTRRLSVHATSLRTRSDQQKAEILRGVREQVLPLIESGRVGVGLDRIFDMEEAAAAHEYFDSGQHCGKIVLRMV